MGRSNSFSELSDSFSFHTLSPVSDSLNDINVMGKYESHFFKAVVYLINLLISVNFK